MARILLLVGVAVAVAAVAAFLVLTQPSGVPTSTQESPEKVVVRILRGSYDISQPDNYIHKTIRVVIGINNTVIWRNNDVDRHDIRSDSGAELASPLLTAGEEWKHTFGTPGTFAYHCTPHPWMKGTVTAVRP